MEKNFVEFFSVQFVEPTFTFHHPPSINHERHHALPPERILFPGRVFSLTLPLPEFLSHLPANVNYNLNMNIGACTLACAFVLHDFARTRDPEKKRGGRTNDAKRWIRKNCIRFAKVDQYSFRISRSPPRLIPQAESSFHSRNTYLLPTPFPAPSP